MKKLSSLFLTSAILFSAMPLSAGKNDLAYNVAEILFIANFLSCIYLWQKNQKLETENQDLKAKLEESRSNQQKPKQSILDKDKEIRREATK